MKVAILLTTYNRPEYLKTTIDSLNKADLSDVDVLVVDDRSTDHDTINLIQQFKHIINDSNRSIRYSLLTGFNHLFDIGYEVVINLDSDVLVRNDFVSVLLNLHNKFPNKLITGFNCNTLSLHGHVRHHVVSSGDGYNVKKSVGGVNMLVTKDTYNKFVKPALERTLLEGGNWDNEACKLTDGVICAVPSVIQHIGYNSSMGHTGVEPPDVADDFKPLSLSNITLIGVDCMDINRLIKAIDSSCKDIIFGDVRVLSSSPHPRVTDKIDHIGSKEEYSKFCIKELYKYITTDYCLIIQYDGYVIDYKAWTNEFLRYDYIGAPWEWLTEQKVGNGGFSLRSKRLMELVANDEEITDFHPEDDMICHKYGRYLERKGINFAPVELARKFSIEGYKSDKRYRGQFGFHGTSVVFNSTNTKKVCVLQPFGLGDVIFCQTLVHSFKGYDIVWPVKDCFVDDLNRAYPDIKFISEKESPVNLKIKRDCNINGYRVIPIRWSDTIRRVPYHHVMRAKYDMYRIKWQSWKDRAMWVRDTKREDSLYELLGLNGKPYTLVNTTFGCDFKGKINIVATGEIVNMRVIPGYSLFDWAKVIEEASEIHTVSTSLLYILDLLETSKVNIYIRKPNEVNHSNYSYIFTNQKFSYSI